MKVGHVMTDSVNSQQADKVQHGIYAFDRLPDEIESGISDALLKTLLDLVLKIHAAVRNPEPDNRESYDRLNKAIKAKETETLRLWAVKHELLETGSGFDDQWEAQGRMSGAEHHVYFDEATQLVIKRNIMGNHDTWLQYLQRIAIHNVLFPAVAYTLTGFLEAADRTGKVLLMPLVQQSDIHADDGAEPAQVLQTLFMAGLKVRQNEWFIKAGLTDDKWNRYLHPATGILIYDLLPKNVLLTKAGNLAFIDALIELDWITKVERLRRYYGEEQSEPGPPLNLDYFKKLDDTLSAEIKTMPKRTAQAFMDQTSQILTRARQHGEA